MYTLKGLDPSENYDLALGFSEIWRDNCSVEKRVMIISVNGVVVKENFDVFFWKLGAKLLIQRCSRLRQRRMEVLK